MAKISFKQLPDYFLEPTTIEITSLYPNSMVFESYAEGSGHESFCTLIPKRQQWENLQIGDKFLVYLEKYMGGGSQSDREFGKLNIIKKEPRPIPLELDEIPEVELAEEDYIVEDAPQPTILDEVYESLNEGQKTAYNAISASYSGNSNDTLFFITGSPGTGKSYLSKAIMLFFKSKGKSIVAMAPSHKAKKVLAEALGQEATTVARYCGYTMENTDNPSMNDEGDFVKSRETDECYLAIVDETSMVTDLNFQEIRESAQIVVALGDKDQLKAINEESANLSDAIVLELTEQMRQENLNTALYKNIQTIKGQINKPSGFQYEFDETFEVADNLVKEYIAGNVDVIIAYRNVFVDAYNTAIQTELTGDPSLKAGDKIIFNKPANAIKAHVDVNGRATYPIIRNNGDTATILKIHDTQPEVGIIVNLDIGSLTDQTRLILTRDQWATRSFVWELWLNYWKPIMQWKQFKRFAINASLPFAITAHKSQGSTYENVGINIADINACWKDDDKNRMLYVAMSRAKNKCLVKL